MTPEDVVAQHVVSLFNRDGEIQIADPLDGRFGRFGLFALALADVNPPSKAKQNLRRINKDETLAPQHHARIGPSLSRIASSGHARLFQQQVQVFFLGHLIQYHQSAPVLALIVYAKALHFHGGSRICNCPIDRSFVAR